MVPHVSEDLVSSNARGLSSAGSIAVQVQHNRPPISQLILIVISMGAAAPLLGVQRGPFCCVGDRGGRGGQGVREEVPDEKRMNRS